MQFLQWDLGWLAPGLTYTVVTNIALLGLTVSGVLVLSAAVTVPFHYCGGNINVGELGLAMRGAGGYVGWVGNTVKN